MKSTHVFEFEMQKYCFLSECPIFVKEINGIIKYQTHKIYVYEKIVSPCFIIFYRMDTYGM